MQRLFGYNMLYVPLVFISVCAPGFSMSNNNKSPLKLWKEYVLCVALMVVCTDMFAQASLVVLPKRIVFDGTRRTRELNLGNGSADSAQYLISVVDMKMKENGTFEPVTASDSGQNTAGGHIRVYPRYVTLGPNEAQTVKVQLVNVNKLPPGEYRSHIYIKTAPPKRPAGYKKLEKMVTNLSVKLTPVFGITIPVIIRVGQYSANISFEDLSFTMEKADWEDKMVPRLNGTMKRAGSMSVYGNLSVEHVSPDGLETHVALIKGIAVYAPNDVRKFKISLDDNLGVNYTKGKMKISFTTQVEDRYVKMADAYLSLE